MADTHNGAQGPRETPAFPGLSAKSGGGLAANALKKGVSKFRGSVGKIIDSKKTLGVINTITEVH